MKNIEFELQTVTPLFLHGADPGGVPELRVPSIRGCMRYWFRAAAGAVIGDRDLSGLRSLEQAVFGQSEECASPISVRINQKKLNITNAYILPHQNRGRKQAISAGETFTVKLSAYRQLDPAAWDCAISALLLATTLGGLGQRSRRGYGTVRINSSSSQEISVSPKTLAGWQAHIPNVILGAMSSLKKLARAHNVVLTNGLHQGEANFPTVTSLGQIWIGNKTPPFSDNQVAVTGLMDDISKFITPLNNSNFLGYSSTRHTPGRQASPLWVRVIQTNPDPAEYQLLFTVLASQFTGSNYAQLVKLVSSFPGSIISIPGWNA